MKHDGTDVTNAAAVELQSLQPVTASRLLILLFIISFVSIDRLIVVGSKRNEPLLSTAAECSALCDRDENGGIARIIISNRSLPEAAWATVANTTTMTTVKTSTRLTE